MGENRRRDIMNKYALGLNFSTLNGRAVLVSVKEDS
jgi:hypothetical protein